MTQELKVPFQMVFSGKYCLDKSKKWLLDTISIYGVNDDKCLGDKVKDFFILIRDNSIIVCPYDRTENYVLFAQYLTTASTIYFKADDYPNIVKQYKGDNMKINIANKLDTKKLMESVYSYENMTLNEPYIIMSRETATALAKEFPNADIWDGHLVYYNGYKILIDDSLDFGEVDIR